MFTTKKAQEQTFFWWVFAVAVLIVVVISIQKIGENLYPSGQQPAGCRATIEAMDKEQGSILSYFVSGTKVPMQCETNWVGNLTETKKTEAEQKEELLNQIVPLTHECWYEFGEGKLNPFESQLILDKKYCFVCSRFTIDFDKLASLSGDKSFSLTQDDFNSYINSKKRGKDYYSSYFEGAFPENHSLIRYVNFSNPQSGTVNEFYLEPLDKISYSDRNDYAVVMFAFESSIGHQLVNRITSEYHVFIMPYENVGNIDCEELVKKKRTE